MVNLSLLAYIKILRKKTGASILACKEALLKNNYNINRAIEYLNRSCKIKNLIDNLNHGLILDKIIYIGEKNYLGCLMELGCETDFVAKNEEFNKAAVIIFNYIIKYKIFNRYQLNKRLKPFLITLSNKFGESIRINKLYHIIGSSIISYNHNKRIGVLTSFIKKDSIVNNYLKKQIAMHIAAIKPFYLSNKDIPISIIKEEYKNSSSLAYKTGKNNNIVNKIVNNRLLEWYKDKCLLQQPFIFDSNISIDKVLKDNNLIIDSSIRIELGNESFNII